MEAAVDHGQSGTEDEPDRRESVRGHVLTRQGGDSRDEQPEPCDKEAQASERVKAVATDCSPGESSAHGRPAAAW